MNPDLVERLKEAAQQSSDFTRRMSEDKSARNQAAGDEGAHYSWATPEQTLEGQAAALILTLQSSLAEQEKTISKLREEVKEAREDYFRRHNDAVNAFEENVVLQSHLAEARNSGLEEAMKAQCDGCSLGDPVNEFDYHSKNGGNNYTYPCHATAIRSLKSQEKKVS